MVETTETIVIPTCEKHSIVKFTCKACDKTVCTQCVFDSKDELGHLKDHYDSIAGLVEDNKEFTTGLHEYEGFELLNKTYLEYVEIIDNLIDSTYEKLYASKHVIIKAVKDSILSSYLRLTETFEKTVKEVNSSINSLNISDQASKEEFKKIKKSLDDQTEFLDSEEKLKAEFDKIIEGAFKRFARMKIPELAKDNFKFIIGRSGESLDLVGCDGSIVETVSGKGGSYWCVKSEECFTGEFVAKIKVVKIDKGKTGTNWSHGIGIIRKTSVITDNYYNDSIVLQSNGYLANKFTGSGTHKKLFENKWEAEDVIIVKRDKNNNVYFGINDDQNMQKAFDGITGEFRLVLGFSVTTKDDVFELIEIFKA